MKKFLAVIAVLGFAASIVSAQNPYAMPYSFVIGTNQIAASGTQYVSNAVPTVIGNTAALQCSFKMQSGAETGNISFVFAKSVGSGLVSGANAVYETTPSITVTVAANGTSQVTYYTNVTVGACASLQLVDIVNGCTNSILTNMTVKMNMKHGI